VASWVLGGGIGAFLFALAGLFNRKTKT